MPAFTVDDSQTLASYLNGMTDAMANDVWTLAESRQETAESESTATVALYYKSETARGTLKTESVVIAVTLIGTRGYVVTDEYHPRKDGKADLVFHTDYVISWSE